MVDRQLDAGRSAALSAAGIFRLSTDDLPEKDRLPYYREMVSRGCAGLEIEPLDDAPFRALNMGAFLPDLSLMYGEYSSTVVRRTRPLIAADGKDDLVLLIPLSGAGSFAQRGRQVEMQSGEAALAMSTEAAELKWPQQVHKVYSVALPARRLRTLIPHIEDCAVQRIAHATPALHLLVGYLDTWQHSTLAATPQMLQTFSNHIYDLMALLFNARGDTAVQARQRGGREAMCQRVMREIDRGYADPDFGLTALAARVGASPRYVQMLLAQADTSFLREVTHRRIQRVHALLQSPARRHRSVTEIAYDCGFSSLGHFYRLFRRVYGATPGDVRERA
jgi:AraC-like DNA-binding protein